MREEVKELIGRYFPVLDYGFVSLVDVLGDDCAIEAAARVSYGAGTRKTSQTKGLLRFLLRQKHTSPFEQLEIKLHVGLPIFIARQWIRHRVFNFSEYSGRYSIMPTLFYTPKRENLTTQATNNKQGRSDNTLSEEEYQEVIAELNKGREHSVAAYKNMLGKNVARELARIDLPLSMYTFWYCKVDLHNLFHFLRLRCDSHAQWEFRQYANVVAGMAKRIAPHAFSGWLDYVHLASNFTYLDKKLLNSIIGWNINEISECKLRYKEQDCRLHEDIGMTDSELAEFWQKLEVPEVPNFDLDLSVTKDASYFEELIKNAT